LIDNCHTTNANICMEKLLKPNLQKQFGEMFEDGVESIVIQMSMFFTSMMVEVDEVFNVVM